MTQRPTSLSDASAVRLVALNASPVGDHFEGTIQTDHLPDDLHRLFAEFEEVVEGQMFSLLNDVESRIRAARLRIVWEDGTTTPVEDLQVFPSTGAISFRATPPAAVPWNGSAAASRPTSPHT